jgi:hypothetical protein
MRTFLRRVAPVLLVAAAGAALLGTAAPASAGTGLVYSVVNADGGVYYRNSPHWSDTSATPGVGVYNGDRVELICGAWGDAVGPYANRRWHLLTNLSRSVGNGWVADRFLNTPNAANQPTLGEPECGATPPATPAQQAVNWALARVGQPVYQGYCLSFVYDAYGSAGVNIGAAPTAVDWWNQHGGHHPGDTAPPLGALVFWGPTAYNSAGHVGLALGNGQVVSSEERSTTVIHTFAIADRNAAGYPYLGWIMP